MKPSTLEAIQEALLQVDLLADIEDETGDFRNRMVRSKVFS
jgi:hypothetical protein